MAESLYCGAPPINCLNLRHINGERAVWYLDGELNRIGGGFREIDQKYHAAFARLADEFRAAILSDVVCRRPTVKEKAHDVTRISAPGRHDITQYLLGNGLLKDRTVVLDEMKPEADDVLDSISSRWANVEMPKHLAALLALDLKAELIQCLNERLLRLPSPIDGTMQLCNGTFLLAERATAYRFLDNASDLPYYLLAADWPHRIAAILFPTLSLTIYASRGRRAGAENSLGEEPHKAIFKHAAAHADSLADYVADPTKPPSIVYSYWHLGHHIWNELTGLELLLNGAPITSISSIYVLQPNKTEMYGKLDEIFPEIKGRIDRSVSSWDQLREAVYRKGFACIRLNDIRVSRSLARRIINCSETSMAVSDAPQRLGRLATDGYQIILLGLRVENRTVVDLSTFCIDLIQILASELDRIAIVVDGHNIPEGANEAYISHCEGAAARSPLSIERELVNLLASTFAGTQDIEIIDTVGQPMGTSIFWANQCRFFVTPWGAGLAKYRWVCNRPGLVLAGHAFLGPHCPHELHLYDKEYFMESPTMISFLDRTAVTDAPEAPLNVPDPRDLSRVNFRVDRDALRLSLREIIKATIG